MCVSLFLPAGAAAFIVPEELVSFLSIVYSNIPPVRKGTDSRVGLGFRLGPHADAQIVLELGPQTNTRPLGSAGPSFGSPSTSSKRHTYHLDDGVVPEAPADDVPPPANPAAGNWLTAWRTSVVTRRPPAQVAVEDNLVNPGELSAPGTVNIAVSSYLQMLQSIENKQKKHIIFTSKIF
ncbi:hypothetical protein ONE63_003739 [Megalurothrips usitatus]|uniref:Uncharacterized protein n=1 Tax=Megalurothrips usitatus TaxID=439358 RepID=A0AAV7X4R0_9NEOP|nr:hypothetical protein ONE63_003739 [Megalurothrips usitatus]